MKEVSKSLELRKDEANFASPLLSNDFTGEIFCEFDRHWKKNSTKMKQGGAQRAFFKTKSYGVKLLNVSAMVAEIEKSPALSKAFILSDGDDRQIMFTKPFLLSLEKGRITGISPVVKQVKEEEG